MMKNFRPSSGVVNTSVGKSKVSVAKKTMSQLNQDNQNVKLLRLNQIGTIADQWPPKEIEYANKRAYASATNKAVSKKVKR